MELFERGTCFTKWTRRVDYWMCGDYKLQYKGVGYVVVTS
jgi:hypothetical protein